MMKRLTYPLAPSATPTDEVVELSDEQLAVLAADAGCSVEELRAVFAADPITRAELVDAARIAERIDAGEEQLTYLKL